jgi:hypothetical protein
MLKAVYEVTRGYRRFLKKLPKKNGNLLRFKTEQNNENYEIFILLISSLLGRFLKLEGLSIS